MQQWAIWFVPCPRFVPGFSRSSPRLLPCPAPQDAASIIAGSTLVRTLGSGGFGRADLISAVGEDGSTTYMVLKTLLPRGDGSSLAELLSREVAGLQAAAGSGTVRLYGCSRPASEQDPHQVLMEYASGGTLATHVVSARF